MTTIAIIDYGVGNVKSISGAFENVGAKTIVTRNRSEILDVDGVVLPGVGAFAHGMEKLNQYDLVSIIEEVAGSGKPFLGICLGMQMLFTSGTEFGNTPGLGLIPGRVKKLPLLNDNCQKLPHVSWNELKRPSVRKWENTVLDGIHEYDNMYFVHSFFAEPDDESDILSLTEYSDFHFCSTVRRGNIFGCQYHPEKSAGAGLKIVNNFTHQCRGD
ncbi:MAG: imidazole glycerol phosphate synthase subunit HisH [Agarilytica sp.]